MSRQKGSFGLSRLAIKAKPKKEAKETRYPVPHSSEREIERRLRQLMGGQIQEGWVPSKGGKS